jgi:hypothetical protein
MIAFFQHAQHDVDNQNGRQQQNPEADYNLAFYASPQLALCCPYTADSRSGSLTKAVCGDCDRKGVEPIWLFVRRVGIEPESSRLELA